MTMTTLPKSIEGKDGCDHCIEFLFIEDVFRSPRLGLRVWNYDGSSTEQADGHNSVARRTVKCCALTLR